MFLRSTRENTGLYRKERSPFSSVGSIMSTTVPREPSLSASTSPGHSRALSTTHLMTMAGKYSAKFPTNDWFSAPLLDWRVGMATAHRAKSQLLKLEPVPVGQVFANRAEPKAPRWYRYLPRSSGTPSKVVCAQLDSRLGLYPTWYRVRVAGTGTGTSFTARLPAV